ncbi:class II aldolase/adducin family protein [Cutibacterium modestum]|jgi:L-fuculose-phosphate aldolase|uniref:Class II aldolase n=3 Tax=Bacillati TaxID=1783272 RepID=A0AAD1NTW6_9ACTN|nr:class II aldolase/adducin family protein [Cutibacterium modestum]EGG25604.1 putative L-ribulose-5-phosphate 4-epimerase [Cutibacterium modestum P08]MCP2375316.1 class II aldolase/adducin family protein [Cutibacterium modestum 28N]MCP2378965.1 class II aldolase/adducin family protein [Cutibacterium modestum 31N]MCP2380797.1 class II aldolase/adducin family protein [Cutibacterium modestum 30N]BCY24052.1 class II aldolase [Cutibacterium modestum]
MICQGERQAVVDVCQELQRKGLVVGTAGNVSVRVGNKVCISPSAVPYEDLTADLVGVHDLNGEVVEAQLKPSSELPLHLAVYHSTDARGITHNHAPASTALGLVCDEVPFSHYYSAMFGGPIRVSAYANFGTDELAHNVVTALDGRQGALMSNHGAITIGPTLDTALSLLPYLEYICEVQLRAMSTGRPVKVLNEQQITFQVEAIKEYSSSRLPEQ